MTSASNPSSQSHTDARSHAQALMAEKDRIEETIATYESILHANNATMTSPLVDSSGFPRADIDVMGIRNARVELIRLRNDYKDVMEKIGEALVQVHATMKTTSSAKEDANGNTVDTRKAFARIDDVASGSPADVAGLKVMDEIVSVNDAMTMDALPSLVQQNENV